MARTEITVAREGAVASLTLCGEAGNLLTETLLGDLAARLSSLADEPAVRVAMLRGADGMFCAGWNQDEVTRATGDPDTLRRLSATMQAVAECPLPLIAALEGDVFGGGLELALACDVRFAASGARFGFLESRAGVPPLAGGVARLARLAGRSAALRLLLTGEPVGADEALTCGLITSVHAAGELHAEAARLAAVIASRGPIATRYAKEAVSRGTEMPLDHALRFETDLTIILQSTADRAEGISAFAEKRTPHFRGH
jgi:enoyl-CoA hydratase/carnithine racemase